MSLLLPPTNHPARELFDVAHLVEVSSPSRRSDLPTLQSAKRSAIDFLAAGGLTAAKSITSFVLRANDELHLITFGPRGGMKIEWNFGKLH